MRKNTHQYPDQTTISIKNILTLREIASSKHEKLDRSIMSFAVKDSLVSSMLILLKQWVQQGDEKFSAKDFSSARNSYDMVAQKIGAKIPPENRKKMGSFIKALQKRIDNAVFLEYKTLIDSIDIETSRHASFNLESLERLFERYKKIADAIAVQITNKKSGLIQLCEALACRLELIITAIIELYQQRGDELLAAQNFNAALREYKNGRHRAEMIDHRQVRTKYQHLIDKKISMINKNGKAILLEKITVLINQAQCLNLQDKTDETKAVMTDARLAIESSGIESDEVINRYNESARIIGVELLPDPHVTKRLTAIKKSGESIKIGTLDFVAINEGEYLMGSTDGYSDERPQHKVYIAPFWIGRFAITQQQYKEITGEDPSVFKGDNRPVDSINWQEATDFCLAFSKRFGVTVRLPYEAEWEYACRAGTRSRYYWGNDINQDYCWYFENSDFKTHPVGLKFPNKWGLFDMCGNLFEWCMDWYDENYYAISPRRNPQGPRTGMSRILRGGSWGLGEYILRSATRYWDKPQSRDSNTGFRIVLAA